MPAWFTGPAATLTAAVIAAFIAAVSIAFQLRAARKAREKAEDNHRDRITIAIATDIATIISIFEGSSLITHFAHRCKDSGSAGFPFAAAPRNEDYFALFHAIAPEIGRLDSTNRVRRAVEFYHFLKASRDAAVPLGSVTGAGAGASSENRVIVQSVLLLLQSVLAAAEKFFQATTVHRSLDAEILAIYAEGVEQFIPRAREEIRQTLEICSNVELR